MMIPHGHLRPGGGVDADESGSIRLCYDGFCAEWHSRNARALNTIGGGLIGGLGGAILGGLVGGRKGAEAGLALGVVMGGGVGYSTSNPVAGYAGGIPILRPHRHGSRRGPGGALPAP